MGPCGPGEEQYFTGNYPAAGFCRPSSGSSGSSSCSCSCLGNNNAIFFILLIILRLVKNIVWDFIIVESQLLFVSHIMAHDHLTKLWLKLQRIKHVILTLKSFLRYTTRNKIPIYWLFGRYQQIVFLDNKYFPRRRLVKYNVVDAGDNKLPIVLIASK